MKTSREELLDLGEEIVCRQGFGGFSYGALADRAGIRKASIHHHFPSKSDFGRALMNRCVRRVERAFEALETDRRRGSALLRSVIQTRRTGCAHSGAVDLVTAMSADPAVTDPATREGLASARETLVRHIAHALQVGRRDRTIAVAGDIEEEARAVFAQIAGAELAARASGNVAEFDRALATLDRRMSAY
ncbi:TetR/AcrR family transcriptional regulator [Tsuneonella sp. YG55]|uniref:TetR/AcrR family transcriptional regulator n=1 Tax=Tsuneonella litorea TaxID=2976475 RepID=A0A9X3AM56_9SPHN|nr:TetR/AcrR family transcriptional regulator [Tsuneonella litorea]MCT2560118.1 TetR/AcrR family transcriptional regulator [Tsuneonella litorea]